MSRVTLGQTIASGWQAASSRVLDPSIVFSFDQTGFERHRAQFEQGELHVDMTGRTCLVTGANSGLGYATAHGLAMRDDAAAFGWASPDVKHNWAAMRERVQNHIKSLNFQYRVALREAGISYLNKLGEFAGPNTLKVTDKKGKVTQITAARFVVAVGGRPNRAVSSATEGSWSSTSITVLSMILLLPAGRYPASCS